MAVYTVTTYRIDVIGYIWMPNNVMCAMSYDMRKSDLENILEYLSIDLEELTRDDLLVEYLDTHTGDFSNVVDFRASLAHHEIPWKDEESEYIFTDCMLGDDYE